jgi:predicted O-methyltransferase YrrM
VGVGSMRFISIDGGHTPEHTVSDLNLACRLINNQGVVILDDVLHHPWPG